MAEPRVLEINVLKYINDRPPFDGKAADLPSFISSIDDVLPLIKQYDANGQRILINTLKTKITGKAKQILDIHGHINDWIGIKNILVQNFSSHRSVIDLYEDLKSIAYKGNVLEFYNEVQYRLSVLNQKCKQENRLEDIPLNINSALGVFKGKISEPMKSILFARNPNTIENALNYLSEGGYLYSKNNNYNNERIQKNFNMNKQRNFNRNNERKYIPQNNNNVPKPMCNFCHKLGHTEDNCYSKRNSDAKRNIPFFGHPNTTQPRVNNHVEPMDIDPSSQTRRNYYTENQTQKRIPQVFQEVASEIPYHM